MQAPEMVNAELDLYDERVDVWYIGCLALILFSNDIHKVAKTKEYWFIKATPEKQNAFKVKNLHNISLEAINFINKAMRYDYKRRPKAPELLEDDYFKVDLDQRSTLEQTIEKHGEAILKHPVVKKDFIVISTVKNTFGSFYDTFKDPDNFAGLI